MPRRTRRTARPSPDARAGRAFARLVRIMAALRSPAGCPWDRKQTASSLRPFLLEETYEALDAIDQRDLAALRGELGDVLFQCVFQAQIAAEAGRFDIADSVQAIVNKLIRRHPHVFTPSGRPLPRKRRRTAAVRTPTAVVEQWERLKAKEQTAAGEATRLLSGVPRALPALLRAHEIGTRVAAVGFDWPAATAVIDKMDEEVQELRESLTRNDGRAEEELGDLLFSIANLARKLGLEPESALRAANDKFAARFAALEAEFEQIGRSIHDATLDDMEAVWARVKVKEAAQRRSSRSAPTPSESARPRRRSRR